MRPVSATTSIDAPRERVFDLLCDLSARPAFTDHLQSEFRLGRIEPVGTGASARYRLGDSGEWFDTVIEAADRPHMVREQGRGGRWNRVGAFTVWELAEGPGGSGCELTVTFWTEPETMAEKLRELRPGARRLRRGWERALRRLRDLVEDEEPVVRVEIAGGDRLPSAI